MQKKKHIQLRVSTLDKKLLQKQAQDSGLSLSEYLLQCGLRKQLKMRLDDKELEAYLLLNQYHSHFNRISNLIKVKSPELNKEVLELSRLIKTHLNRLER